MRVPQVLLKCKVSALTAVALMVLGTIYDEAGVRAWALLAAMYALGLGLRFAIRQATEAVKAYVHRWSLETFEHGYKQGVELGREMEAAQRFIDSIEPKR